MTQPLSERIESASHGGSPLWRVTDNTLLLIAVSKQQSADAIRSAIDSGHGDFGENRMDEIQREVA